MFLVDDDYSVRRALRRLLRANGLTAETFASATEFLELRGDYEGPACLILDVCMPEVGGLDLQSRLAGRENSLPIVFITGHGDIPMSVRAMKAGAVSFLTKPFSDKELMEAVSEALTRSRQTKAGLSALSDERSRLASLTPRERQVFDLVVTGLLNKQIAADLGIAEKTVKVHRARVMTKMNVRSLAELVRVSERLRAAGAI